MALTPGRVEAVTSAPGRSDPPFGPPARGEAGSSTANRKLWSTLAVAAVMGVLIGRFLSVGGDTGPGSPAPRASATGQAEVADLQRRLGATPDDPALLARLGIAYLGRTRETADPTFYTKADQALQRSQSLDGANPLTMTGLGLLAQARHDFTGALEWARQVQVIEPGSREALGIIVDALVELGRYDEAAAAAQEMVDRRPSLASLARVSLLRELHGDVAGAITAMTQAAIAGRGGPAADVAFVETVVGDLEFGQGRLARAEAAYRRASELQPGFGFAEVGLARVTAARGDLDGGVAQLAAVVTRLPFPAWVAWLGDMEQAAGRTREAAEQFELVRQIQALDAANGVDGSLETARFEADHARAPQGQADAAVDGARAAREERPTIFADDTLGWALRQAGRAEEALTYARGAVRLGTADAVLWYHLAATEADLGMLAEARDHLDKALSINPHLTVRDLPDAVALAARLGLTVPGPRRG